MIYYIILYFIILYFILFYYVVLYCIVLYYIYIIGIYHIFKRHPSFDGRSSMGIQVPQSASAKEELEAMFLGFDTCSFGSTMDRNWIPSGKQT
jgi:hypothetical protein